MCPVAIVFHLNENDVYKDNLLFLTHSMQCIASSSQISNML
ncbi:unnamed protein product, partial [Rotaria magnacalcarata]